MPAFMDYYEPSLIRFYADGHRLICGTIIENCQENRFFIVAFFHLPKSQVDLMFYSPALSNGDVSFPCKILHSESQFFENEELTVLEVFFDQKIRPLFEGKVFCLPLNIDFSLHLEDIGANYPGGYFYYWSPDIEKKSEEIIEVFARKKLISKNFETTTGASFLYRGTFERGDAEKGMPIIYGGHIISYGPLTHLGNAYLMGFVKQMIGSSLDGGVILEIIDVSSLANLLLRFEKGNKQNGNR